MGTDIHNVPDVEVETIAMYAQSAYDVVLGKRCWRNPWKRQPRLQYRRVVYHYIMELITTPASVILVVETPEEKIFYDGLLDTLPPAWPTPPIAVVPTEVAPAWLARHRVKWIPQLTKDATSWLDNYILRNGQPEEYDQ